MEGLVRQEFATRPDKPAGLLRRIFQFGCVRRQSTHRLVAVIGDHPPRDGQPAIMEFEVSFARVGSHQPRCETIDEYFVGPVEKNLSCTGFELLLIEGTHDLRLRVLVTLRRHWFPASIHATDV